MIWQKKGDKRYFPSIHLLLDASSSTTNRPIISITGCLLCLLLCFCFASCPANVAASWRHFHLRGALGCLCCASVSCCCRRESQRLGRAIFRRLRRFVTATHARNDEKLTGSRLRDTTGVMEVSDTACEEETRCCDGKTTGLTVASQISRTCCQALPSSTARNGRPC